MKFSSFSSFLSLLTECPNSQVLPLGCSFVVWLLGELPEIQRFLFHLAQRWYWIKQLLPGSSWGVWSSAFVPEDSRGCASFSSGVCRGTLRSPSVAGLKFCPRGLCWKLSIAFPSVFGAAWAGGTCRVLGQTHFQGHLLLQEPPAGPAARGTCDTRGDPGRTKGSSHRDKPGVLRAGKPRDNRASSA